MKKALLVTVVAVTLFLGACCFWGPEGDVYLTFSWTYAPEWFASDDPNLPDTIYRDALYETDEGTWYFEYYHAESRVIRWITYSLEAHDGAFGLQGEDAIFELFLAAYGDPGFVQWQSEAGDAAGQPRAVAARATSPREPAVLVQDYEQTIDRGGWRLELRGGTVEIE